MSCKCTSIFNFFNPKANINVPVSKHCENSLYQAYELNHYLMDKHRYLGTIQANTGQNTRYLKMYILVKCSLSFFSSFFDGREVVWVAGKTFPFGKTRRDTSHFTCPSKKERNQSSDDAESQYIAHW